MRIKTRDELRAEGKKLPAMPGVCIRLPPALWEKCAWAAHEMGISRPEFVRIALTRATRGAKPPEDREKHELGVTPEEWQAWNDAAAQLGQPLDKVVSQVMRRVCAKALAGQSRSD